MQQFFAKKRTFIQVRFPDTDIYSCRRCTNHLTPVNQICTAGSGRSEVVLSAYWSITE